MNRSTFLVIAAALLGCSNANTTGDDPDKTTAALDSESSAGGSCGNGVREGDEVCDGSDLGDQQCTDLAGFVGGTLACASSCAALDTHACMPDPGGAIVRLNELTSAEITDGELAGALDAIEIYNAGMAPADLSGLQLSDDPTLPADKTYVFAEGTQLAPGAFLVLVQRDDATGVGDYPFGISGSKPEQITLAAADGAVIDTVELEAAAAEVSWCRVPDGDGEWQSCERSFGASNVAGSGGGEDSSGGGVPGCGDGVREGDEACDGDDLGGLTCQDVSARFVGGTLACDGSCQLALGGCELAGDSVVVINEVSSSGDDEIELYNAGATAIDLAGFVLTDGFGLDDGAYDPELDDEELVFDAGVTIAAGEYLVILKGAAPGHPFGLGAAGDRVALLDPEYAVVDFVQYGDGEAATSYCRVPDGPDGAWQADCLATFGDANEAP